MADEIVLYLQESWNVASIKAARAAVADAHIAQLKEPTTITGVSNDGSSMSMTVSASSADRMRFMMQCREAIALLQGDALPSQQGLKFDFSTRCAST